MNRKKSLTTSIKDFFSSQLGLFILGALITTLLIPWFFQVWQDYQKELEIKSDLVGRISESVTRIVMFTQSFLIDSFAFGDELTPERYGEMLEELNSEYLEWEITSSVIDSQLKAYFPHTSLSSDWGSLKAVSPLIINESRSPLAPSFSNNVSNFYAASANSVRPNYNLSYPFNESRVDFGDYGSDRQKLLEQRDEIIQHILDSQVSSFASNPFQQILK